MCRQSFSDHPLPRTDQGMCKQHLWCGPCLALALFLCQIWGCKPDWIPGSYQDMPVSFIPLGLWSQNPFLAWDLFSPEVCLGTPFIFQDSDGRQLLSFHTFMPYAHPSAPNLYYRINQSLYSLSYLILLLNFTTFTSLHVFIFLLYWKELKDRSYAFFFPLAQCLVCIRCLINTCWIKEWLEHLSSNVRVSAV